MGAGGPPGDRDVVIVVAVDRDLTADGGLDDTMAVRDGDVVMVPKGYHPVGAAHGYELYYLNVMAGPKRVWKFTTEPAHEWLVP